MTDRDAPTPPDGMPAAGFAPDVPEADAFEQAQEVGPEPGGDHMRSAGSTFDAEVPEADALEQAVEVPLDDGYER